MKRYAVAGVALATIAVALPGFAETRRPGHDR